MPTPTPTTSPISSPTGPLASLSTFICEDQDGVTVAEVACESVREHQAAVMREQLRLLAGRNGGRLAIGLARVTGLPASLICDLMWVRERCERLGGRLVLFGTPPNVVVQLRTLGLIARAGGPEGPALTLAPDRREAVAACRGEGGTPLTHPSTRRVLSWLRGERAA